ncbi:unnamed protein product [Psylliodes chrysocephalus]|uniref:glucose-6-phosphate 1-epimerase n=1 Tax=Psylliodes chrysocephalus TaxID=3402493 RepID=A0A9P0DBG2_9CUCU|nr:unnamed protein product [Psylliodes chrysocephala]
MSCVAPCTCPPHCTVTLDRGLNTICIVDLHGATIVSWKVNDEEQLFVSQNAVYDCKKAIRGGVPIVFPHFGPWPLGPRHGFARIITWKVEKGPVKRDNGDIEAVFSVTDQDRTKSLWNFAFKLTYTLVLGEKTLQFKIAVHNPSKNKEFTFNLLLHTYFKVQNVQQCSISGLKGCIFRDDTKNGIKSKENRETVTITEFVDRVYEDAPAQQFLIKSQLSKIRIQKLNFPDTVVWNPWIENSKAMDDFGDEEYLQMVCVESGHVSEPVILRPSITFEAGQILELLKSEDQITLLPVGKQ